MNKDILLEKINGLRDGGPVNPVSMAVNQTIDAVQSIIAALDSCGAPAEQTGNSDYAAALRVHAEFMSLPKGTREYYSIDSFNDYITERLNGANFA
jgi:hypothetical protein